ncbi:MAG: hypothetical protein ABIS18_05240 [Actinomycetota bacterium]
MQGVRADTTATSMEFVGARYLLLLPEIVTKVDEIQVGPTTVRRYRWWSIAILAEDSGFRFLVERSIPSPVKPYPDILETSANPEIHYAEAAESVVSSDPNAVLFEEVMNRVTVTVNADLPKTGTWSFTAGFYNSHCVDNGGIRLAGPCGRTYAEGATWGQFTSDTYTYGTIYPQGSLGGERIVGAFGYYNQRNGLFGNATGWISLLHV